jgi:hypothetical protein
MRDGAKTKRLFAALAAIALVCGSGFGARAQNLIYFEYTATDALSGNQITTFGSMTLSAGSGTTYDVTSLSATRYDGDGIATLSLGGGYGDYYVGQSTDNLLYLSSLIPPVAATPPFDQGGITFNGSGTNGDGSTYIYDNLVSRTMTQLSAYASEPYFTVSPLGVYEDVYTAPITGVGTAFVLDPITSFDTSDTPFSAPAPVPGTGGLSFAAGLAALVAAAGRRVRGYRKA